jgi:hypothetical protein
MSKHAPQSAHALTGLSGGQPHWLCSACNISLERRAATAWIGSSMLAGSGNTGVNRRILVLGATRKTGSRVASKLSGQGVSVRTETIASGRGSQPNGDVLAVTGAVPISFADFASKTAPA